MKTRAAFLFGFMTFTFAVVTTVHAATSCPAAAVGVLNGASRLVVVTTPSWNLPTAKLRTFERVVGTTGPWRPNGSLRPAVVGKSGLAWGFPFSSLRATGEPLKHEGDGRTPAGVYRLGRKFGFVAGPNPGAGGDFLVLDAATACVDDVDSSHYNTVVEEGQVTKDWKSAEMMRTIDLYKIGFLVDYPSSAQDRAGSCIFVHIWRGPGVGTSGCLASTEPTIAGLHAWVTGTDVAAVVFLPEEKLGGWLGCLPGVSAADL